MVKDIENLFDDDVDDNIFYKPILINSSFKKITEFMKGKEKKIKIYQ